MVDEIKRLFGEITEAFPTSYPAIRRDIALTYENGSWSCDAGNTCPSVHVCEAGGEWSAPAATPELAMSLVLDTMRARLAPRS